MSNGVDFKGVQEVLTQFDYRATPFFAIYQQKDLKFKHLEEDLENARAVLSDNLEQLFQNGSNSIFKIKFYKRVNADGEDFDQKTEMGSNTFKLNSDNRNYLAMQPGEIMPYSRSVNGNSDSMAKILDSLNAIDSRLTAIEMPLEDEAEEREETPTDKIMGFLGAVVTQPGIVELFGQKLMGLLSFIPSKPMPQYQEPINNTNMPIEEKDVPKLNEYLEQMIKGGMQLSDFQKLAEISQNNPKHFTWLLSLLKSQ